MALIPIHEPDDPRIAPFRHVRDRTLRDDGLFVAEGPFLLDRMVAAGLRIDAVLAKPSRAAALAQRLPGVSVFAASVPLLRQIVGYRFHRGVVACARRPEQPTLEQLSTLLTVTERATPPVLVVAPWVLDHENVGSLARVAAAFGAAGMLIGPRSCDPFWRRAIRVSAGAVFSLPIRRADDLPAELAELRRRRGLHVYAAVLHPDAQPLTQVRPPADQPLALMIGPEDHGLFEADLALADQRVTIPMPATTDSLNLAVAAAVCLYELTRRP